jgi:hypothetical protein
LRFSWLGLAQWHNNGTEKNEWIDVYKSGFLLLGGGVTTAVGYFFSSGNQEETQKRTVEAIKEFQGPDAHLTEEQPTTDETSLKEVR